jgi:hypothetical protein
MNASLFLEYIDKYFRLVVGKITEKFNDKTTEQTLLHKTMLTEEYSADLNWGATELNHSIVAADVVALDSSLPLKKRGVISNASGKLPKIGVKYRKGEKLISDINIMIARGADEATIASKIFDDTTKVIRAIDVRTEIMFLQALSTGIVLATDDDNTGTGVRANFGYKDENTFHAIKAAWGKDGYTPIDDIQQLFDKAQEDSNAITQVYLSKKYFNLCRNSEQGKLLAAAFSGQVITDKTLLPTPTRTVFLDALADEFGATFHVVDSVFKIEKADGTTEPVKPWEEANIIGTPDSVVGRLVYGTLAEETNPVNGVNYQKSGSHILVSKYSKTDPLEEFTAGQTLAIPVIDGADSIYILHADATDAKQLTVDPTTLSFAAAKGSEKFDIHYDGDTDDLTVTSNQTWATVKTVGDKVTVTVAANTSTARTATVTVSDGTNSATVTVSQEAGA